MFAPPKKSHNLSLNNLKITMENLVALLNHEKYSDGIDPATLSHTIDDIYRHVAGDKNSRIRLPAPINCPDDRFDLMWPEGARVSSKPPSDTSHRSSKSHRSNRSHLSSRFTRGNIDPNCAQRAMSVASSQFSKRYVGFIDEEDESDDYSVASPPPPPPPRRRSSGVQRPQNTVRVQGGVVKPTPSLEKMFAHTHIGDEEDEDHAPRPPVARNHRASPPQPIRPLDTESNTNHQSRRKKVSRVGFGDE